MSWLTHAAETAVGRRLVLGLIRLVVAAVLGALGTDVLNADPLQDGAEVPRPAIASCASFSNNPAQR